MLISVIIWPFLLATLCSSQLWQASYQYLLADFNRCKTVTPDVLIWVQGRAADSHLRSMIRQVYANPRNWPEGFKVAVIFFTGTAPANQEFQALLQYEFELYGDIVQNRYVESYYNQTYKMISAINYIAEYCPNTSLILRIDDDVLFHPRLVLPQILSFMNVFHTGAITTDTIKLLPSNTITCKLISDYEVWRKKDHPKHFNAVDDTVLPGEKMYPPFCAGFFIAMSGDVPGHLSGHIATNKPFWMDDRYMGVLQKRGLVRNIDISPVLDFGYKTITEGNVQQLIDARIAAKHLPGKLKLHLTELFEFIDLANSGLRGYFHVIGYGKKKKKSPSHRII